MIRVLVADDHPVVRTGLREILARRCHIALLDSSGLEVVKGNRDVLQRRLVVQEESGNWADRLIVPATGVGKNTSPEEGATI